MEEVEDSVVDALQANPKLVDSITEQIRFGASQLVPQLLKSFQSSKTLDLGPFGVDLPGISSSQSSMETLPSSS